jgi:hypothetical protein
VKKPGAAGGGVGGAEQGRQFGEFGEAVQAVAALASMFGGGGERGRDGSGRGAADVDKTEAPGEVCNGVRIHHPAGDAALHDDVAGAKFGSRVGCVHGSGGADQGAEDARGRDRHVGTEAPGHGRVIKAPGKKNGSDGEG